MHVRRLQLVAGTTYTVSLPKTWVQRNGLRARSPVAISVRDDQTLSVAPEVLRESGERGKYELNVDEYGQDADQLLFALFYLGYEEITLTSDAGMAPSLKTTIKRTLAYMTGTEIVYEDDRRIQIRVLLAPERLHIAQVFFRIGLIISACVAALKERDADTLEVNETEVDRLYHLIVKIITLALSRADLMKNAGVGNICNLMPYFLIAKRLEHLTDNLFRLSKARRANVPVPILDFIDASVRGSVNYIVGKHDGLFKRTDQKRVQQLRKQIGELSGEIVRRHLAEALRCAIDVEEETLNLSFYLSLAREGEI